MNFCVECNNKIPPFVLINGKRIGLHTRKKCLICFPNKSHIIKTTKKGFLTCSICMEDKPFKDFCKNKRCKKCMNKYITIRQRELKKTAIKYKGGKCEICKLQFNQNSFSFHHLNPKEKEFEIGGRNKNKFEDIKKELDKCILVCHNCHAEIHFGIYPQYLTNEKESIVNKGFNKICKMCNEEKDAIYFSGLTCKKCLSNKYKEKNRNKKEFALNYKGNKCIHCGYNKCMAALDFHHISPLVKSFTIAVYTKNNEEELIRELDKCELVCRNCHALKHHQNLEVCIF